MLSPRFRRAAAACSNISGALEIAVADGQDRRVEERVRNSLLVPSSRQCLKLDRKWAHFGFSISILNENIPQVEKCLQSFSATSAFLA
jgi:hypothetical protein